MKAVIDEYASNCGSNMDIPTPDVPTLYFVIAVLALGLLLSALMLKSRLVCAGMLRSLCASQISVAGAFLLLGLRSEYNSPTSIVLSNLLIFWASMFMVDSALRASKRAIGLGMAAIFSALFVILLVIFFEPTALRVVVACLLIAGALFVGTLVVLNQPQCSAYARPALRLTSAGWILSGLAAVLKAAAAVYSAPEVEVITRSNWIQVGVVGLAFFGLSIAHIGLIALGGAIRFEEVVRSAELDVLTESLNRRGLGSFWEKLRAAPKPKRVSLLLIDIDNFKVINDTYGHGEGDLVLMNAAASFKRCLRDSDCLARVGGEEFCVVLPGLERNEAVVVADRVLSAVKAHVSDSKGSPITVSIGIVTGETTSSLESLIGRADRAMYRAKNSGRDRWSLSTLDRPTASYLLPQVK